MIKTRKEYLDTLDRIFLNELKLKDLNKNTRTYEAIKQQVEKDKKLANEYYLNN